MTFKEWYNSDDTKQKIVECNKVAVRRLPAQAKASYTLLEDITDLGGWALELQEEARNYYLIKLAELTAAELEEKPNVAKKTTLDYCKNLPCEEKKAVDMIDRIVRTFELRAIWCQSLNKGS